METGKLIAAPLLILSLGICAFLTTGKADAAVKLSGLFSDHMVVQRNKPFRVWGKASAGETVKGQVAGQSREVRADQAGNWQIAFEELDAGGPYELKVQGENQLSVKDILCGDVFLCAGQSNMVYPVSRLTKVDTVSGAQPRLRLFSVPRELADRPSSMCQGAWQLSGESARNFSAIGYLFGREMVEKANVPIGVIDCSYSGTPIDAWLAPALLNKFDHYRTIFKTRAVMAKVKGYSLSELNSKIGKSDVIDNNNLNVGFIGGNGASLVYNGMVSPLVGYPLKAIIWYQGEGDLGQGGRYGLMFSGLIQDWRKRWAVETDIPFYFVQLPNCDLYSHTMGPNAWPAIRAAQAEALVLGSTGMVVTIDSGNAKLLNPANKEKVAQRMAGLVLRKLYDMPQGELSPVVDGYHTSGSKVLIHFDHAGKGLDLRVRQGNYEFEMADIKGRFFPAVAEAQGAEVLVSSTYVVNPTEVRYAWRNCPAATIFNSDNMPAAPFKLDVSVRP